MMQRVGEGDGFGELACACAMAERGGVFQRGWPCEGVRGVKGGRRGCACRLVLVVSSDVVFGWNVS
jgi:hypothetical protein